MGSAGLFLNRGIFDPGLETTSKFSYQPTSLIAFARTLRYNICCFDSKKRTHKDDHIPHSRIL